jgi:A/G-specific adenine glycosylase
MQIAEFRRIVWEYYQAHGRHDLPWRQTADPYCILVSEIMLQQTQVPRVVAKYQEFLRLFPTTSALAAAPLGDVLRAWSGLGYNRRAKYLWEAAQRGPIPSTLEALVGLPGVGVNTAGAVLAYAFNQPAVFVETNIRSVILHHFFADRTDVPDSAVREKVAATLDAERPREWYWALMDYGSYLKQATGNASRRSRHYTRQSAFQGSRRQLRGAVLRNLSSGPQTIAALSAELADERLESVLDDLLREGLINRRGKTLML